MARERISSSVRDWAWSGFSASSPSLTRRRRAISCSPASRSPARAERDRGVETLEASLDDAQVGEGHLQVEGLDVAVGVDGALGMGHRLAAEGADDVDEGVAAVEGGRQRVVREIRSSWQTSEMVKVRVDCFAWPFVVDSCVMIILPRKEKAPIVGGYRRARKPAELLGCCPSDSYGPLTQRGQVRLVCSPESQAGVVQIVVIR